MVRVQATAPVVSSRIQKYGTRNEGRSTLQCTSSITSTSFSIIRSTPRNHSANPPANGDNLYYWNFRSRRIISTLTTENYVFEIRLGGGKKDESAVLSWMRFYANLLHKMYTAIQCVWWGIIDIMLLKRIHYMHCKAALICFYTMSALFPTTGVINTETNHTGGYLYYLC